MSGAFSFLPYLPRVVAAVAVRRSSWTLTTGGVSNAAKPTTAADPRGGSGLRLGNVEIADGLHDGRRRVRPAIDFLILAVTGNSQLTSTAGVFRDVPNGLAVCSSILDEQRKKPLGIDYRTGTTRA